MAAVEEPEGKLIRNSGSVQDEPAAAISPESTGD
jgi:hypothetical protein